MNKNLQVFVRIVYILSIVSVNVVALLFLLITFQSATGEGPQTIIPRLPGRYGMLYYSAAVFAPACITLSLGVLLRRATGFSPDLFRRLFRFELMGLIIIFFVLLLMRYFSFYR